MEITCLAGGARQGRRNFSNNDQWNFRFGKGLPIGRMRQYTLHMCERQRQRRCQR